MIKPLNLENVVNDYKVQVKTLEDNVKDIQNINDHYKTEFRNSNIEKEKLKDELTERDLFLKSKDLEIKK